MDGVLVWVRGGGALPVAASVLVLCAYACGGSTNPGENAGAGGGSSSVGGAGGGDVGGSGGAGPNGGAGGAATSGGGTEGGGAGIGPAGAGGEAGAGEGAGGGAGAAGVACIPVTPPDTSCEYPESLGGGKSPDACGVTPGAWFGIGDASELTTWPERATVTSAADGLFGSFRQMVGSAQVAFDAASAPLVAWQEKEPAGGYVMRIMRRAGGDWVEVATRHADEVAVDFDLLVDSSGRPLVVDESYGVKVLRFTDSVWETLGEWHLGVGSVKVVLDAEDRPTIVYRDFERPTDEGYTSSVVVQRWTGSAWEDLGVAWRDTDAVLALRANGDPVIAYYDASFLMVRQWGGSSWEELDGSASGSGLGNKPEAISFAAREDDAITLAVDADDRVVVAWGGSYRVWNGSAWSAPASVGGPWPRLARNAGGALYLMSDNVLNEGESLQERILYRWTNEGWESLLPTTAEYTEDVDLAVAPDGTVGMAFGYQQVFYRGYSEGDWSALESPADSHTAAVFASHPGVPEVPAVLGNCRLGQWNGTTWEVVPPPTSVHVRPPGAAHECDFARSFGGSAYLAFWTEDIEQDYLSLRVVQQTDQGWEIMGDPESEVDSFESATTRLAIDARGRPVVAWLNRGEYSSYAHVLGWNGSSWTSWGDSSSVPLPSWEVGGLRLTLTEDGRPVLALTQWDDEQVLLHVSEWTGESWRVSEAMTRADEDDQFGALLAVDATDAPVVSWPSQNSLELARWSGSAWEQLPPTDDVLASLPLSLRVNVMTRSDEVLFRYFEDCAWRGLSGSDQAGGISNSTAESSDPALWATEHAVCVRWSEQEGSISNYLMRCHEW